MMDRADYDQATAIIATIEKNKEILYNIANGVNLYADRLDGVGGHREVGALDGGLGDVVHGYIEERIARAETALADL